MHYAKNGKSEFDIIPSDKTLLNPKDVKLNPMDKAVIWAINRGLKTYKDAYGESVEAWYKANNAETKNILEENAIDKYDFDLMVGLITDKFVQYPNLLKQIDEKGGLEFLQKSTHTMGNNRWSSNNPKNMFIKALIQAYKNTNKQILTPAATVLKTFTNYSGAAKDADTIWANIGKEFGLGKQVNYRPEDLQKLTKEQLQEVENAYQQAVKDLGRKSLDANTFAGGLVRRDYLQAKSADAVFAISTIVQPNEKDPKNYINKTNKPLVAGGTGYAVQMAINLGKPVYVFDQIKNKWFVWKNNNFVEITTPILTQKFAGIGTREINENGKQAIRDVYEKSTQSSKPIVAYRTRGNNVQITDEYINQLIQSGNITYTDEDGKPCAEVGLKNANFTKGGKWKVYEIFEGKSHKQGGIDINIKNNQISFTNKNGSIKAKYGLVIPKGD